MRRHGPVIAHCTDSEDFPKATVFKAEAEEKGCSMQSITHVESKTKQKTF